jgi:hypothetical protein
VQNSDQFDCAKNAKLNLDLFVDGKTTTTKRPTAQGPTTSGPTTKRPTTQGPTTSGPTTKRPTTQGPTT